jgi:small-conductance mechanosensitive channel
VRRTHLVPLLVVWVIPVAVAAVLLALADLGLLALALLVIEVVVGIAVFLARRQPEDRPAPSRRPWLVPALMIGSLVAMVAIAVVASKAG